MASGARSRSLFASWGTLPYRAEVDPTAPFHSILHDSPATDRPGDGLPASSFFADLHLDEVVAACTGGGDPYGLRPVFHQPLTDAAAITYRHDVFRDLEQPAVLDSVREFAGRMDAVHRWVTHAQGAAYRFDQQRWLLRAAEAFGVAVGELAEHLQASPLRSAGLVAFRDYLVAYTDSAAFRDWMSGTRRIRSAIQGVSYRLRVHGTKATVTPFRAEPDLSAEVLSAFDKFRGAAGKEYGWRFDQGSDMNHVEAAIVDMVARLQPTPFTALAAYAAQNRDFLDAAIVRFDREIRFYLAYLAYIDRIRDAGLAFCYPQITDGSHEVEGRRIYDLALAASLVRERRQVVPNDVELRGDERVIVVSGPNQGGKTTFARAIGQLHHLARIGVPVPGERVALPLVDHIFTHFERQEVVEDLTSKLEDDLRRIHAILKMATPTSLLIMNESFSSTTVSDQLYIGARILGRIVDCGLICVIVTFLDELAAPHPAVVSMMSTVDLDAAARRTFEVVRRPADGLAYAMAIAERHRLTYSAVRDRLGR